MKRFEYSILTVSSKFSDINKMLRDVGEQGWEVSGVIPESSGGQIILKRELFDSSEENPKIEPSQYEDVLRLLGVLLELSQNICASQERREAAVKAAYYFLLLLSEENVTLKNMFVSYMAIVKYDADPYLKIIKK